MKNLNDYVANRYNEYQDEFQEAIKEADSVSEMLHVYACYTGKLEALLDGITIEARGVR